MNKKILIKLSGEALSNNLEEKYTEKVLEEISVKIKSLLDKEYKISIVVGGGNLFRGRDLHGQLSIKKPTADYIGMISTVQNALVLRDYFESQSIVVRVMSAIPMDKVCEPYIPQRARRHLAKNRVVIFAAGLGNPFFTTDSAATQRALELGCEKLIMAKSGVDGVYTADPKKDSGATKIENITCSEILSENLQIADASSISLARDNGLGIKVVSMENLDKIEDENIGTNISSK